MYNLIRYYNQNRKKIWLIIAIIAFALILLRTINNIVAEQKREESANKVENEIVDVQSSFSEDYTVTGEKIAEDVKQENTDIIDNFLKACNARNVEEAYNMLSDACKEVKYPTLESFVNIYYNTIFTEEKAFNKQAWMEKNDTYTYRITIINDPLAKGKVSYSNSFQDFYTIVKQDQDLKLNISSFVARENLEKSVEVDNVIYNVKYRDCYMDYEEYVLEVTNNTNKVVALDSKETTNKTYLIGESDNKFSSFSSEMNNTYQVSGSNEEDNNGNDNNNNGLNKSNFITNNIIIPANTSKKISIKFNKMYNPERKITKMEFSDIIEDYESYLQTKNKNEISRKIVTISLR